MIEPTRRPLEAVLYFNCYNKKRFDVECGDDVIYNADNSVGVLSIYAQVLIWVVALLPLGVAQRYFLKYLNLQTPSRQKDMNLVI